MPRSVSPAPKSGVVKHRACDECRSRKLACSKELDGCSRCRREGIRCVYSPQKPMGRPRKRRNGESVSPKEKSMDSPAEHPADTVSSHQHDPTIQGYPLDPDFSYYAADTYNSNNAGLMDYMNQPYSMAPATSHQSMPIDPSLNHSPYQSNLDSQFQYGGGLDILGGVGFDDEPDPQEMEMREYVHRVFGLLPHESTPSPAAHRSRSHTPEPNKCQKPLPSAQCQCLSSIYLGLDALNSSLPTEPFAAIRIARRASQIAYEVVTCPSCGVTLITREPLGPPPIESFQNLMLLCALIPSACNAYARILEVVDEMVREAKREKRKLHFAFRELGGLWGKLTAIENSCMVAATVNDKDLEPDTWRKAVRATLRADIYGFASKPDIVNVLDSSTTATPIKHPGLKQVVRLMEERSRMRHQKFEELSPEEQQCMWGPGHGNPSAGSKPGEREYQCLKIIECARVAVDRLVIA